MSATLEIACFSPEDAVVAATAGAHRIELCRNYDVGGSTPSINDLTFVKERVQVPVFVMIRERAGDYVYSNDELVRMRRTAHELISAGADGIVFGVLTENGRVDEEALLEMVEVASPKPVTFHRAFDDTADPFAALDALSRCGVARVLTSGGQPTAMNGAELLALLVSRAVPDLTPIPGGGVRSNNVLELIERTRATEVHSAARTDEPRVDPREVRRLVSILA